MMHTDWEAGHSQQLQPPFFVPGDGVGGKLGIVAGNTREWCGYRVPRLWSWMSCWLSWWWWWLLFLFLVITNSDNKKRRKSVTVWVPRVQVHDAFAASGCCDGASKGEGHFDIRQSHGGTRLSPKSFPRFPTGFGDLPTYFWVCPKMSKPEDYWFSRHFPQERLNAAIRGPHFWTNPIPDGTGRLSAKTSTGQLRVSDGKAARIM